MGKISNDQMQVVQMCIQTFFNLYGAMPSKQELLEWLGASYEDRIPDQLAAA